MARRISTMLGLGALLSILTIIDPGSGWAQLCTWPIDPTMPVALSPMATSNANRRSTIASDGNGGAIVLWTDTRNGTSDIFGSRVSADGVVLWGPTGNMIAGGPAAHMWPAIAADGSGGAVVAWIDDRNGNPDVFVQRVAPTGFTMWGPDGIPVCTAAGNQGGVRIVSDGSGGAIVAWLDARVAPARVYAAHVTAGGVVNWAVNGVQIHATPANALAMTSDGAGGAIITWDDSRGASAWDIYAQRINAAGALLWPANGVAMTTASTWFQNYPAIVADGSGGAIVAWLDDRPGGVYAQRVNSAGVPQWAADGVSDPAGGTSGCCELDLVSDGANGAVAGWTGPGAFVRRFEAAGTVPWTANIATDVYNMNLTADGTGGAISAWHDSRPGAGGMYVQRVSGGGTIEWRDGGVRMNSLPQAVFPDITNMLSDGRGGAIVSWSQAGVFANRVDMMGQFGVAAPRLTRVKDIPNDEGGRVKLEWDATCQEDAAVNPATEYWILRSAPPNMVAAALARGARLVSNLDEAPAAGAGRVFIAGAAGYAWELLGTQVAFRAARYSFVAATTSDSVDGSNPLTAYSIQARSATGVFLRFSNPDSGYSVDNLAPAAAGAFVVQYFPGSQGVAAQSAAGYAWLHWTPSAEPDFGEYRIHRGASPDFIPSAANLVVAQGDTGYVDQGAAPSYYKLFVADSHGNLSQAATAAPSGVTGVGDGGTPAEVSMALPWPNPTTGDLNVSLALPRSAHVSLGLFDVSGRSVAPLAAETMQAGPHQLSLRLGEGSRPALANGVYYLRLEVDGRSISRRVAVFR